MLRKTIRLIDTGIDRIVIILSLFFFLICLYAMYDAAMVYYNANDSSVLKYKPHGKEDVAVLKDLSEDAVAWLTIKNTEIDYPVMHSEDNSEYLNKDPYGEYSLSGSIFLDSRCRGDFKDEYSLIYGHHMDYGAMFGALDYYTEKDFFKNHKKGTIITVEGTEYEISLFACLKADATEEAIFDIDNTSNEKLLMYLKKHAIIFENPQYSTTHLIALSTCQSAESNERMIVVGTLKEQQ